MSFTGNYICTSFKVELLRGLHDFTASTGHVFRLALYTSSATLDASTTAYSATNEISGTAYVAGGMALTNVTPTSSGTTALVTFSPATWDTATFTARGGLIYNDTAAGNPAVCVLDFGLDRSCVAQNFVVTFPPADLLNAIIRIA